MDDKKGDGRLAVIVTIIGMLAFVAVVCWAVVGTYLEYRTGKRLSQQRMQRVQRQIEEREAEAGR